MRTFSKIYGLAGLRIGYGIAPAQMVDYMNRVRQPFNVNLLAQEAALAALDDDEHVERSRRLVREGKLFLYKAMEEMGLEYVPSETNFFLIRVGDGEKVFKDLLKRGVIVRNMGGYGLSEYIRVTLGTHDENVVFLEALREVLGE
jgi:histidinol-phosphate aminotransferase